MCSHYLKPQSVLGNAWDQNISQHLVSRALMCILLPWVTSVICNSSPLLVHTSICTWPPSPLINCFVSNCIMGLRVDVLHRCKTPWGRFQILSYKIKIVLTWVCAWCCKAYIFVEVCIHTISVYVCVCDCGDGGHFFFFFQTLRPCDLNGLLMVIYIYNSTINNVFNHFCGAIIDCVK